jgi:hypothetical protein
MDCHLLCFPIRVMLVIVLLSELEFIWFGLMRHMIAVQWYSSKGCRSTTDCHEVCCSSPVDQFCFGFQNNWMTEMVHCTVMDEPHKLERHNFQGMAIPQAMVLSDFCRTCLTCESRYNIPLKYRTGRSCKWSAQGSVRFTITTSQSEIAHCSLRRKSPGQKFTETGSIASVGDAQGCPTSLSWSSIAELGDMQGKLFRSPSR